MQIATKITLLCGGVMLLMTLPTASQEQCSLPTDQDVINVANQLYQKITSEGITPQSVQDLFQVHFTCLATVALDMYAYATVVANFTTTGSSVSITQQFQIRCVGSAWKRSPFSDFKNPVNIPAMPFAIETQFQCSNCEETTSSAANYNPDSNCFCECVLVEERR